MVELLIIGVVWLVYQLIKEQSWKTNVYKNNEYDVTKAFNDACIKRVSNSEFKKNYKNGKYSK